MVKSIRNTVRTGFLMGVNTCTHAMDSGSCDHEDTIGFAKQKEEQEINVSVQMECQTKRVSYSLDTFQGKTPSGNLPRTEFYR